MDAKRSMSSSNAAESDVLEAMCRLLSKAEEIKKKNEATPVPLTSLSAANISILENLWEGSPIEEEGRGLVPMLGISRPGNSLAAMDELSPVLLKELSCPSRAIGKRLILRVLSRYHLRGAGLIFVTEDSERWAILLNLEFPLPKPAVLYSQPCLEQLFPIGSFMAIKEPAIRYSYCGGLPEVYVGMMCDVQLLSDNGPAPWPSLQMDSNQSLSDDRKPLGDVSSDEQAYLGYCRSERMLSILDLTPKQRCDALLSASSSALAAGKPGGAYRHLQAMNDLLGDGVQIDKQQRMDYLEQLKEVSQSLGIDPLTGRPLQGGDPADCPSKPCLVDGSWGIVATRDIEFAEVVRPQGRKLVTVPPATELKWDFWIKSSPDMQPGTTAHVTAVCKAIHNLIDDPRKASDWASLHPRNKDGPATDCTIYEPLCEQYSISPLEISHKISLNARVSGYGSDDTNCRDVFDRRPFGIHIDPSDAKGNHSCMPNVMNVDDGKGQRTIATCQILRGEEIFSTYLDAGLELPLRQATLQSCWGFECRCELCRLDAHDDHATRQTLAAQQARTRARVAGSAGLLGLKGQLEWTYAVERSLRPALALVLRDLAMQEDIPPEDRLMCIKESLIASGITLASPEDMRAGCMPILDIRQSSFDPLELLGLLNEGRQLAELLPSLPEWERNAWTKELPKFGNLLQRGPS